MAKMQICHSKQPLKTFPQLVILISIVPVAQLDRASASGAEGYRFEPCRGYFLLLDKDLRRLPSCCKSLLFLVECRPKGPKIYPWFA